MNEVEIELNGPVTLDSKLEDLYLSVRTINITKNAGIIKISDLVNWSEKDLLSIKNLGRRSLEELKYILELIQKLG